MQRSPLLPRHEAEGARLAPRPEAPDSPTVLTFGDVPAEYRAALEGVLLLDACDAGRLRIAGGEAAAFLHRILASDVRGLGPGEGGPGLLLTPKGKVLFQFELHRFELDPEGGPQGEGDGFVLSTAPGRAPALAQALDGYLFGEDVRIEDRTAESAPLELVGPGTGELLAMLLGAPPPATPRSEVEVQGLPVAIVRGVRYGSPAWILDAGPEGAPALWGSLRAAGARPGGLVARDSLRVEAASALPGVDVTEDVYPQEARLESAFSLEKGCYVGQEVVAKIDTYGGLNKRLCVLALEDDDPVAPGTRLRRRIDEAERDLGLVTSWAYSFALDRGAVLAYVKRRHQEPGTEFDLDGRRAVLREPPLRPGTVLASAPGP